MSGLLLVLEQGPDPASVVAAALGDAAARLAAALGTQVRRVTWAADPPASVEAAAAALAEHVRQSPPEAVLLADSDLGRQVAPVLAVRCGGAAVLGCTEAGVRRGDDAVAGRRLVFRRPVHGGWLEQDFAATGDGVPVATLALGGALREGAAAADEAEELELTPAPPAVLHLETLTPDPRSVDLVHARRIVTAGSGAARAGMLPLVEELAGLLHASVGATRVVTDDGVLPKERLIGQTGRTVAPDLYVALGVSGSPHHLAGVRGEGQVIAVDHDVRAPIFQSADVGYVSDLEEVLPALVRRIRAWGGGADDA